MRIFVSNLSFNTGDAELNNLFTTFGEVVSAQVITDRETGRSRGFGFIEMAVEANGNAAIDKLNATELNGRAINVTLAREKSEKNSDRFKRTNNRNW